RVRKRRRLEQDRMVFIAQRVAGRDVLDANNGGDVTRVTGLDVLSFVRLYLNQARDAFAFIRARIVNRIAFAERAGVNTEENEFAYERIAPKFERKRAEISVIVRRRF